MDAVELIRASVAGINLLTKVIETAQEGDLEKAKQLLVAARGHFDDSLAAWDKAGGT